MDNDEELKSKTTTELNQEQLSSKERASLDEKSDIEAEQKNNDELTINVTGNVLSEEERDLIDSRDHDTLLSSSPIYSPDGNSFVTATSQTNDCILTQDSQSEQDVSDLEEDTTQPQGENDSLGSETLILDDIISNQEIIQDEAKPNKKDSCCNTSNKNVHVPSLPSSRKILLGATVLFCSAFLGSLAFSLLGKPLCSDQKGNLLSLAVLGTIAIISLAVTLCCPKNELDNTQIDNLGTKKSV